MITALLTGLMMMAATPYSEVPLDALYVGSSNPLNGKASLNARRVDINGDGAVDLLFPDRVLFQREGSFYRGEAVELPDSEVSHSVDVFEGAVYLKFSSGLKVYRYTEDAWVLSLDTEIKWPLSLSGESGIKSPMFERFVYDIDGDSTPELVFPLHDGLHVYSVLDATYVQSPVLEIFPKTKLIPLEESLAYSNVERGLSYPDQHLAFHCAIEGDSVVVLTKRGVTTDSVVYAEFRYQLHREGNGFRAALSAASGKEVEVASFVQPCRLNADAYVDYAGGMLDYTSSLALLTPIFTTVVQTSPDVAAQTFRTKSFAPHVMFTDFNQDGYADLVLERTDITNGGLRETLNRFTTQRKFTHHLKVHFQQPGGQFSAQADVSTRKQIRLDETPIRLSEMFERYQAGKLLNATGDFNGDGMNDLLIQHRPDEVALFFWNEDSFSDSPDYTMPIGPHETFHVLDLNMDSLSDIIFQGVAEHEGESTPQTRVLLFHGGAKS